MKKMIIIVLILSTVMLGLSNLVRAYSAVFNFNDYYQFYTDVDKTVTIPAEGNATLYLNVTTPFIPTLISRVLVSFIPNTPDIKSGYIYYEYHFDYMNVTDTYLFLIFDKSTTNSDLINLIKSGAHMILNGKDTQYIIYDETDSQLVISVKGDFKDEDNVLLIKDDNISTYVDTKSFFTKYYSDKDIINNFNANINTYKYIVDQFGNEYVNVTLSTTSAMYSKDTIDYINDKQLTVLFKVREEKRGSHLGFRSTSSENTNVDDQYDAFGVVDTGQNGEKLVGIFEKTTNFYDWAFVGSDKSRIVNVDDYTIQNYQNIILDNYIYLVTSYQLLDNDHLYLETIVFDYLLNKQSYITFTTTYSNIYNYLNKVHILISRPFTPADIGIYSISIFYLDKNQHLDNIFIKVDSSQIQKKQTITQVNYYQPWMDKIQVRVILTDKSVPRDFVSDWINIAYMDLTSYFYDFIATNTNLSNFYIPEIDHNWFILSIYLKNTDTVAHNITITKVRFDSFQEPLFISSNEEKIHAYLNDYSNVLLYVNNIDFIKIPTLSSTAITERFVFYVNDLENMNNNSSLVELRFDNFEINDTVKSIRVLIYNNRVTIEDEFSQKTYTFNVTIVKYNTFLISLNQNKGYFRLNDQIYYFNVSTNTHKLEYLFLGGQTTHQVDVFIDDVAVYDYYVNPQESDIKLFTYYYLLNINDTLSYLTFYNDDEFPILNLNIHYYNGSTETTSLGTRYIETDPTSIRQYLYLENVNEIEVYDSEGNYLTTFNFELQDEYYKVYPDFNEHFIYVLSPDPSNTIIKIKNLDGFTVYSHHLSQNDTIVHFTYPTNQYVTISIYLNGKEVKSTQTKITNNVLIIDVSNTSSSGYQKFDTFVKNNKLYVVFVWNKSVDIKIDIYQIISNDKYIYNELSENDLQTYSYSQDLDPSTKLVKVRLTVIDTQTHETIQTLERVIPISEEQTTTQNEEENTSLWGSTFVKLIILTIVVSTAVLFVFNTDLGIIFSYISLWVLNLTMIQIPSEVMTLASIFVSIAVLRLIVSKR